MNIAITTPTGNIGRGLIQFLVKQGTHELTLLVRDPEKLNKTLVQGAHVKVGNLQDVRYFRDSTEGVDCLFFLIPPDVGARNVRDYYQLMAKQAADTVNRNHIPRVVLLSSVGAHLDQRTGPILGLRDAEIMFGDTDAHVMSIRPTYFMENFLGSVPTIQQANAIYLPVSGSIRVPFVATQDIGELCGEYVADADWKGKQTVEFFGPKEVSFDEVAAEIGRALGREIQHIQVTPEQAEEALKGMGLGASYAKGLVEIHSSLDNEWLQSSESFDDSRKGRTTLSTFVKDVMVPALSGAEN